MRMQSSKFHRKHQEAIAALLETPTYREAAERVGVGQATLFRWMQLPEFQEAYRAAKHQVVTHAVTRVQSAAGEAVGVLRQIMLDAEKPASSRVTAARTLLDVAIKALEMEELQARVEELEARLDQRAVNG